MDSLQVTKDTAARWIARKTGEAWSAADQAELDRWLKASTGNLIAYLRLEAAWKEADRLKVLGAGAAPGTVPTLEDFRASPFFKHVAKDTAALVAAPLLAETGGEFSEATPQTGYKPWAIAASVLAMLGAGMTGWMLWNSSTAYSTPVGVTAAVPLSDGSKVTLNTDSEIRVALTAQARTVKLDHGEAFFEVVEDAVRPFTVDAGNKRIVVLGTKFSVRRDGDAVRVIVTEGRVRVDEPKSRARRSTHLSAGSVASTDENAVNVQERTLLQTEEMLSWRSGYVVFHETSLADAANEFNRYNNRKFVVKDPAVATISISGNFRATNVDSFVRLLEDGFPVLVEQQGERIVLKKRP